MYFLLVQVLILLHGLNHVHSFFHFRHLKEHDSLCNKIKGLNVSLSWLEQRVDHFNDSYERTFKQRYIKYLDNWKPDGPIVLYLNGESALRLCNIQSHYDNRVTSTSPLNDIVKETGAALFLLEHRYYGKSQPFDNQDTENLLFLSSRQALADAAYFLKTLKDSSDFKNSKVIVVGGSYAGNLAAWMKLMYPSMIDAALASSPPVLAKKDFYEYLETVTETFRKYGSQECVDKTTAKFNRFHELLKTPEGIKKLKEENHICDDSNMTILENQQVFLLAEIMAYAIRAQYGDPDMVIKTCADNFELNEEDVWFWLNRKTSTHCIDSDINTYANYFKKPMTSQRPWFYQTCTEFGYYQSTTSNTQMFGNSLPPDFYYKLCRMVFGDEFNEVRIDQGVVNTNKVYQGLSPNVTNVVFVNGDMDPWHRLSVLHDLSDDAPAIYLNAASHCNDLSPHPNDTKEIKEARKRIIGLLKKWIGHEE